MTTDAPAQPTPNWHTYLFFGFVILLSYFTYFHNYAYPKAVFWDENYHIASAEKYLNGVYFMEQHPPLGKLLIALGEKMFHPNPAAFDRQFIGTDYATNFDTEFSFAGFRFFSALLGWLTAPLLFLIFLLIVRQPVLATLLSFFYIFDNAIIVHVRGAMLEGPLLFFSAATILAYFLIRKFPDHKKYFLWSSIFFGVAFGCVMTTKLLGLVLVLLVPAIVWILRKKKSQLRTFLIAAGASFLLVYVSVWQIHFSLGRTINPALPDNGYYQASAGYKNILATGSQNNPENFFTMIKDSWHFVSHYNAGTPKLDLCKADENGSPFYMWPIGARAINYRWETPDGQLYRYLFLQSNPVVWIGTFIIILLSAAMLLGTWITPGATKLKNGFDIGVFLMLYVGFFVGISRITRVLYLYHYFIALLFGFILVGLFLDELQRVGKYVLDESKKLTLMVIVATLIFAGFQFYRPFTYYEPLTKEQVQRRAIIPMWDLLCVGCDRTDGLAIPTKN